MRQKHMQWFHFLLGTLSNSSAAVIAMIAKALLSIEWTHCTENGIPQWCTNFPLAPRCIRRLLNVHAHAQKHGKALREDYEFPGKTMNFFIAHPQALFEERDILARGEFVANTNLTMNSLFAHLIPDTCWYCLPFCIFCRPPDFLVSRISV